MTSPAVQQMTAQQANMLQRQAVLNSAVDMSNLIASGTVQQSVVPVLNTTVRPVGFLKSFRIRMTALVTNTDGANALTLSDFGLANFLTNITFTDLNNNQRINTTGAHISFLNSLKRQGPFASGFALETDTMGGFGENYPILNAPASIAHGGTATIACVYDIPITYSDDDLTGGIYCNAINTQQQLSLTFNPAPFAAAGTDSTNAIYFGASGTLTNITYEIYQNYLDQLPVGQNGIILPQLDIQTSYDLKYSNFSNISPAQDFPVPYANFRKFISTIAVYNHDTTVNTGRVGGTDINSWALQAANFTNFWKKSPQVQAIDARNILGCDLPKGVTYHSFRRRPLSTQQYGNLELVMNPITATNPLLVTYFEAFAYLNTVTQAGSLPG
jgi:hypothetical protein